MDTNTAIERLRNLIGQEPSKLLSNRVARIINECSFSNSTDINIVLDFAIGSRFCNENVKQAVDGSKYYDKPRKPRIVRRPRRFRRGERVSGISSKNNSLLDSIEGTEFESELLNFFTDSQLEMLELVGVSYRTNALYMPEVNPAYLSEMERLKPALDIYANKMLDYSQKMVNHLVSEQVKQRQIEIRKAEADIKRAEAELIRLKKKYNELGA